ncbi:MAG: ABC transporter substrate-binding protein [SAR202 cluster bacterium]|nr:ABC transporter substrate-binding protein [SAR202 cluster bacterium]
MAACGSSATATPTSGGASSVPTATTIPAPTAMPAVTVAPTQAAKPSGTLSMGQSDMGRFTAHPRLVGNPGLFLLSAAPVGETLFTFDSNRKLTNMLARDWSISEDFITWTFEIEKGVQLHKGYGELTTEDVVWSYNQWSENTKHPRGSVIKSFWNNPAGNVQTPDDYTIVVNTGTPLAQSPILEFMAFPFGGATWVSSKKQFDEKGDDEVDRNIAATGPWEFLEEGSAQFWRMGAVQDHWRVTPDFAELVFWEIPEESARVAGFQTGQLDTFVMAFDSIATVEDVPGAKFVTVPQAGTMIVNFYGNFYVGAGTDEEQPAYNPDLAWVSSNSDTDSPEWINAKKVREAISLAIDRDSIIETLLLGFAKPAILESYTGNEDVLPPGLEWKYDPVRAKELLVEAGYPDGFTATLTTAKRGAPAEDAVCEAVASMLDGIGIDVQFQNLPYSTLRPTIVGRTYEGLTCHGIPIRTEPVVGLNIHLRASAFTHGWEHQYLEDQINLANNTIDPVALDNIQRDVAQFMFDEVVQPALYSWDAVWPVGPRIEDWTEFVKHTDTRNINGFEFMRHRQ